MAKCRSVLLEVNAAAADGGGGGGTQPRKLISLSLQFTSAAFISAGSYFSHFT